MRTAVCAALVLWCAGAGEAWAQAERGFVRGLGGAVFGTADTSWLLGGGGGISLGPRVQIVGEVGRLGDVMPSELRDALNQLATLISIELGVPVTLNMTVPTTYLLGGVRANVPTDGRAQPFVEGQLGLARLSFDIEARVMGVDISDEVEAEADLDDESELMLGLGGGVHLAFTDTAGIDLGYRYGRIFTDDPAINTHAVYAAFRLRLR